MIAPATWVEQALMPKGPSLKEVDAVSNQSRIIRDAIHLHQWATAYDATKSLLAFLEHQKRIVAARIAAKCATQNAQRPATKPQQPVSVEVGA